MADSWGGNCWLLQATSSCSIESSVANSFKEDNSTKQESINPDLLWFESSVRSLPDDMSIDDNAEKISRSEMNPNVGTNYGTSSCIDNLEMQDMKIIAATKIQEWWKMIK